MLKIGTFSKISKLSVRMLRHYDDIGLLKPCEVDPLTGYRYYGEEQLLEAGRIQCLRVMGFNLDTIGAILSRYQDAYDMEQFLICHKKNMKRQAQEIEQKLRLIDSTINWLRKDGMMRGYDVTLKTLPERYVASIRQVLKNHVDEGRLWHTLRAETDAFKLPQGSPCYAVAVFHDEEYQETEIDVEVQIAVQGECRDTKSVHFKTEPAVQYAGAICKDLTSGSERFIRRLLSG